jgi:hypothetical protein
MQMTITDTPLATPTASGLARLHESEERASPTCKTCARGVLLRCLLRQKDQSEHMFYLCPDKSNVKLFPRRIREIHRFRSSKLILHGSATETPLFM